MRLDATIREVVVDWRLISGDGKGASADGGDAPRVALVFE